MLSYGLMSFVSSNVSLIKGFRAGCVFLLIEQAKLYHFMVLTDLRSATGLNDPNTANNTSGDALQPFKGALALIKLLLNVFLCECGIKLLIIQQTNDFDPYIILIYQEK